MGNPVQNEELLEFMTSLNRHCWSNGWLYQAEFALWKAVLNGPKQWGNKAISEEDIARLKTLSDQARGWFRWNEECDQAEFIEISEWTELVQRKYYDYVKEVVVISDGFPDWRDLERKISGKGYRSLIVNSAHEALTELARREVKVLVYDLGGSDMDGFELLRRIRATPILRRTVVITRKSDLSDEEYFKACGLGVDSCSDASFDLKEIVSFISRIFKGLDEDFYFKNG